MRDLVERKTLGDMVMHFKCNADHEYCCYEGQESLGCPFCHGEDDRHEIGSLREALENLLDGWATMDDGHEAVVAARAVLAGAPQMPQSPESAEKDG